MNNFVDYILSNTKEIANSLIKNNGAAFTVAIVTLLGSIWLIYTRNILEQIKRRSEKHTALVFEAFDTFIDSIRWKFSGFEAKYRNCQDISCAEYKIEGFNTKGKGLFPLTIEDVFIPLNLTQLDDISSKSIYPSGLQQTQEETRHRKIWDFLYQVEQQQISKFIVVLAAVGYGKTSLLRHITLNYTRKTRLIRQNKLSHRIPILIYLRQTKKFFNKEGWVTLPDLITNYHIPNLRDGARLKPSPGWAEKLLLEGKAIIMFDGFDEVPKPMRLEIAKWINQQVNEYYKTVFIMTSRHEGYADYKAACPDDVINELFVEQLDEKQQNNFLNRWYFVQEKLAWFKRKKNREIKLIAREKVEKLVQQIEQNSTLSDLAGNPLLLTMIATLYNLSSSEEIPHKRTELYQSILNLQLEDRPKSKGINIPFSGANSQKLLQKLALVLVLNKLLSFSDKSVENGLQRHLNKIKDYKEDDLREKITARRFLEEIMEFSQLLVLTKARSNCKVYEFAHISFQEYLAAAEIVDSQKEDLLIQNADDSQWHEIILLYAAQQTDRKKIITLIQKLYQKQTRTSISLAIGCLDSTSVHLNRSVRYKLLKVIAPRLTVFSIEALEKALEKGEWERANDETCQLLMQAKNQSIGKVKGESYLNNEDDIDFVDWLWTKYSKNKFGFSLQKRAYLKIVGKKKTSLSQKAILELSEKLGWRVDGKWLKYEDIKFKFRNLSDIRSVPDGYLPILLQENEKHGDINWATVIDQVRDLATICRL